MTAASHLARTGITLRPMHRRHLRQVAALEASVYGRPWPRRVFELELRQGHTRSYTVALHARRVVGYAGIVLATDAAHVTTVVVRPEHRGRGIATALVAQVLDVARDGGATAATLEVRAGNTAAQRLYRRFGFAPVGVRAGYYEDTGEDALIMWLHDLQGDGVGARLAHARG